MISHDPQPAGLDDDVEPDLGGGVAGVQVGLLGERDAVDRDPALRIAAGHLVTGQADDPLDEDVSRVPEAEHAGKSLGELHHEVGVPGRRARVPRAVPVEDHDVAAVDAADVVDELVDQHPVVDLERVLHRPGRYEEGLDRIGLDDDREQQGDDDQDRELAPERPLPARAPGGRLAAAEAALPSVGAAAVCAWAAASPSRPGHWPRPWTRPGPAPRRRYPRWTAGPAQARVTRRSRPGRPLARPPASRHGQRRSSAPLPFARTACPGRDLGRPTLAGTGSRRLTQTHAPRRGSPSSSRA